MSEPEKEPHISCTFEVFADYHQFYLQDEQAPADTPDDWGDQLTTQMIAVAPGIIGVGTARNMTVPVQVTLRGQQPDDDFASWDHVAEASLEINSGHMVIAGGSDYLPEARRLTLTPGWYRVRVYYGGLDGISPDGLEGEDQYSVVIWPGAYRPTAILKRWSSL
jgi:hypothetical protein